MSLTMSSYYITQIEYKMRKLRLDLNEPAYNKIFDEKDDAKFLRKLRVFNEVLNQKLDESDTGLERE